MEKQFEFEWDPAKALANVRKDKVPFLMACEIFKDENRTEHPDDSNEQDDEERWILLGRVEGKVLVVVYTMRGVLIRLISARRATRDEDRIYWTGNLHSSP
jgi:uncharacterized DUF497 family protein